MRSVVIIPPLLSSLKFAEEVVTDGYPGLLQKVLDVLLSWAREIYKANLAMRNVSTA